MLSCMEYFWEIPISYQMLCIATALKYVFYILFFILIFYMVLFPDFVHFNIALYFETSSKFCTCNENTELERQFSENWYLTHFCKLQKSLQSVSLLRFRKEWTDMINSTFYECTKKTRESLNHIPNANFDMFLPLNSILKVFKADALYIG